MRGWTTLKRIAKGEVPARVLWYRLLQLLGSRSASFDHIYAFHSDPWRYESSDYERSKYEKTLQALPRSRYRRALEIACSIGIFTMLLASRAERVVGVDISREAVRSARRRCAAQDNTSFEVRDLLELKADEKYDLITCAEMLHYVWEDPAQRAAACEVLKGLLAPDGHLVVVTGEEHLPMSYERGFEDAGFQILQTQLVEDRRKYRISILTV